MTQDQRDFITALESKQGRITPLDVVRAAQPDDSPIHECFEWDDTEAANSWRLNQARDLIRRVKIEIVHHDVTIRTVRYVRDSTLQPDETGYRALTKLRGTPASESVAAEWAAVRHLVDRAMSVTRAKADCLPNGGRGWIAMGEAVLAALDSER